MYYCAGATLENYGVKTNTNKANVRYFYPNVRINKKRNEWAKILDFVCMQKAKKY